MQESSDLAFMNYLIIDAAKVSTQSVVANVSASGNAMYKSACRQASGCGSPQSKHFKLNTGTEMCRSLLDVVLYLEELVVSAFAMHLWTSLRSRSRPCLCITQTVCLYLHLISHWHQVRLFYRCSKGKYTVPHNNRKRC